MLLIPAGENEFLSCGRIIRCGENDTLVYGSWQRERERRQIIAEAVREIFHVHELHDRDKQ